MDTRRAVVVGEVLVVRCRGVNARRELMRRTTTRMEKDAMGISRCGLNVLCDA